MVAPRKNISPYLAKNLRYLREQKGFTLDYMARELKLADKTSYYAYELGKAEPGIQNLLKLSSIFDISFEEIVHRDLTSATRHIVPGPLYNVEKVPVAAKAGFAAGYGDPQWVASLEKIDIPFKPFGICRAFVINGDSMEPEIESGSTVVAIKADRYDIRDLRTYVLVTDDGVQCKEVRVNDKDDVVYLISKNPLYPPKHIPKSEVRELWEVWKKIKPGETWELPGSEEL